MNVSACRSPDPRFLHSGRTRSRKQWTNPPSGIPLPSARLPVFSSCLEGLVSCFHPYVRKHLCPTVRCLAPWGRQVTRDAEHTHRYGQLGAGQRLIIDSPVEMNSSRL